MGWGFSEGTHGVPGSAGMLELDLFVGWEAWRATLAGWLESPPLFNPLPLCRVLERVRVQFVSYCKSKSVSLLEPSGFPGCSPHFFSKPVKGVLSSQCWSPEWGARCGARAPCSLGRTSEFVTHPSSFGLPAGGMGPN